MGLLHHIGMVEENAGYLAGQKMANMATVTKAFCLNHDQDNPSICDRCAGFKRAMNDLGIDFGGIVYVPDDNKAVLKARVETAVGEPDGDWAGYGIMVLTTRKLPEAMELKDVHPGVLLATFDKSPYLYEALDREDVLFGIDQQSYVQGYFPVPILTHAAITKQVFLNHPIQSGPSFAVSSLALDKTACLANHFAVCPYRPPEDFTCGNQGLIILGMLFFALQVLATVLALGKFDGFV
jgi:simple sugar transport system substrate-binding protein